MIFILLVCAVVLAAAIKLSQAFDQHGEFSIGWPVYYLTLTKPGIPNYVLLDLVCKAHGSVYIAKTFVTKGVTVFIRNLTLAKRIMADPEWINRFPLEHFIYETSFNKPLGVVLGCGEYWSHSRKLVMKLLHRCGFYNADKMEGIIQSEWDYLEHRLNELFHSESELFGFSSVDSIQACLHRFTMVHSVNLMLEVLFGFTLEADLPETQQFLKKLINTEFNLGASVVDMFPWLRHIPGLTYMYTYKKNSDACYEYFKEIIEKRREQKTYKDNPRDFLDFYLQEVDGHAQDSPNYYTDEAMLTNLRDLVIAGADTLTSALEFAMLHMMKNEGVQKKVQREIDLIVGPYRRPTIADKEKMIYTQAVMLESLRLASPVPVSARSAQKELKIGKNVIPKDSIVGVSVYSINTSEEIWEYPQDFRPERFIEPEGKELINTQKVLPFGFGKRACIGEKTARHILFIFFTSLLKKFTLSIPPSKGPPKEGFTKGIHRYPLPYFVQVTKRRVIRRGSRDGRRGSQVFTFAKL